MANIRYTFPIIYHQSHVYAIGGRVYGDDTVSILNVCEKLDLENNKWTPIAPMNIKRCTCSAFLFNNQIYVFGGYTG